MSILSSHSFYPEEVVRTSPQILSDSQKRQVRENIGAAETGESGGGLTPEQAQKLNEIDNKLNQSQLPEAINTALAQAKASGEFKGDTGQSPVKGVDYFTASDKQEMITAAAKEITPEKIGAQPMGNYATTTALQEVKKTADEAMPKSGGAFTGNVSGKYLTGSWFQTTAATENNSLEYLAAIDPTGWLYKMKKKTILDEAIAPITRTEILESKNLMPPEQELGYYTAKTGEKPVEVPTPDWNTYIRTPRPFDISKLAPDNSGKRPVKVSAKSFVSGSLVSYIFLDSAGKTVAQQSSKTMPFELYVDPRATQMLVWCNNAQSGNTIKSICVGKYKTYSEYVPGGTFTYVKKEVIDPEFASNPLSGKMIVNLGDSIFGIRTAPDDISAAIEKATGASVINAGFGGAKMAEHTSPNQWDQFSMVYLARAIASGDWSGQDAAIKQTGWGMPDYFPAHLAALKKVDWDKVHCVTIAYGTNDYTGQVPLERPESPKDIKTYTGALRTAIETIEAAHPNVNIFVCSQTYRAWVQADGAFIEDSDNHVRPCDGLKLTDFIAKTKAVADEFHLPYIDNYNIGINRYNRSKVFSKTDNTHFNAIGCKMIGDHMSKVLF